MPYPPSGNLCSKRLAVVAVAVLQAKSEVPEVSQHLLEARTMKIPSGSVCERVLLNSRIASEL